MNHKIDYQALEQSFSTRPEALADIGSESPDLKSFKLFPNRLTPTFGETLPPHNFAEIDDRKLKRLQVLLQDRDSQIKRLKDINHHLENFVGELQQQNSTLRQELTKTWSSMLVSDVDERVTMLESKLVQKQEQYNSLNKDIKVCHVIEQIQNRKISDLEQQIASLKEKNLQLIHTISTLEKQAEIPLSKNKQTNKTTEYDGESDQMRNSSVRGTDQDDHLVMLNVIKFSDSEESQEEQATNYNVGQGWRTD